MKLNTIFVSAIIMAGSMSLFGACNNSSEDEENATIVNVEKGVAPPVSTSEADESVKDKNVNDIVAETVEETIEEEAQEINSKDETNPLPQTPEKPTEIEE